jgi:long-chain acyl-CoA synthetase
MEVTRVFDILTLQEEKYNSDIALSVKRGGKWDSFSTSQYRKEVDAFSLGLLAMGFEKGDKIATVSNNRPEWDFIDFGMSQIGCVHVAIYPTVSNAEYRHILSHSDSKILIVSGASLYERLKPFVNEIDSLQAIYTIDEVKEAENWREIHKKAAGREKELKKIMEERRNSVSENDLLTIIYTSGTTGLSKGVMLSHKNVVSNVKLASKFVSYLKPGDRALSFLPLCHVLERSGHYLWQYKGLSVHYAESIETLGEDMKEVKPHTFITVPRIFEKVYDKIILKGKELPALKKALFFWAVGVGDKYDVNPKNRSTWYNLKLAVANRLIFSKWREALGGELKGVIAGGAALQPRLARIFWAAKIIVQEGYGLTETSPVIAANDWKYPKVRFGWVGYVDESIDVKIAGDGEILVKGPNVMIGYYKDPEKTKAAIDNEGWFHTGDIGEFDNDRMLRITDRKKEIFKLSGGKYVAPQIIENVFKESMFIEQIMVVGANRKFTAALIVPDFTFLHNWCHIHGVHFRDNKDLVKIPEVVARYQKEVDLYNKELGHIQQVKAFRLVCENWSSDTGELSPTQKLKRKVISDKYSGLIDEIYQE